MALSDFIPTVWSARLLGTLQKELVYASPAVVTTEYEGEIVGKGSTVKILDEPTITVGDYTANSDMSAPQTLDGASRELVINQAKYFNFYVDDITRAQAVPTLMDAAMRSAAYKLRDAADQYVASLYTDVPSGNTIGSDTTPINLTSSNVYQYLVELRTVLTKNNVPSGERWVIVPPEVTALLLQDSRFVGSGSAQAEERLTGGFVGKIAGLTVYESNNVPNVSGAKFKVLAGYRGSIAFASQVNKVEAYRPEKRFGDGVKGLYLFGAKTIRPSTLALLIANVS